MAKTLEQILAERSADARKARESQKAAAAKARTRKPVSDSAASIEDAPRKSKLGAKAKVEITKPAPSVKPYDFERASKARGGVSLDAPTKTIDIPKKASTQPMAKPQASAPAKTIAQEVAEVKSNIPMNPLPGQGSMEGKPVAKVTDTRGAHITRKPGGQPPAGMPERRAVKVQTAKPAPAKVMTPQGQVVPRAAPPAIKPAGPTKMTAADLFGASEKPPLRAAVHGDLFPPNESSFAAKALDKIKTRVSAPALKADAKQIWEGVKALGSSLDPTAAYRALPKDRTSWQVAKAIGSGTTKVGKGLIKGTLSGVAADYAGQGGYALGGIINKGPGQAKDEVFNPLTVGYDVGKAAMSAFGNEGDLAFARARGRKQGLKVSGGDSGFTAVGKGLVGALTLGRVDLGKDIKVEPINPKKAESLSMKRRKMGEAKYQANKAKKAAPKGEEFSETDYQKLKKTASRDVIKGSYRG